MDVVRRPRPAKVAEHVRSWRVSWRVIRSGVTSSAPPRLCGSQDKPVVVMRSRRSQWEGNHARVGVRQVGFPQRRRGAEGAAGTGFWPRSGLQAV